MEPLFEDRIEAGRALARHLRDYRDASDVVVLGLPRGGMPVAREVAHELSAPLDVLVVRKLGVPGHEELAMGAIASGGVRVMNDDLVEQLGIRDAAIESVVEREQEELEARERKYRGARSRIEVKGKTAVVVDDGLATGATMRAAVRALRDSGARRIVVAVPVGSRATCAELEEIADEVVCAETPDPFHAVGLWFEDFGPVSSDEVRAILEEEPERGGESRAFEQEVEIPTGDEAIRGTLRIPPDAKGIVVFAHGSGSGRHSPRNRFVAGILEEAGFATLLADLLTPAEEEVDRVTAQYRFDIPMLGRRLVDITDWLVERGDTAELPLGYVGSSTGAAAALIAAAERPGLAAAVVSRGGRPDLAGRALGRVTSPVLLIVGEEDVDVMRLNDAALERIAAAEKQLATVRGATHLFEEPGTLEEAAGLAARWFREHLAQAAERERAGPEAEPPRP